MKLHTSASNIDKATSTFEFSAWILSKIKNNEDVNQRKIQTWTPEKAQGGQGTRPFKNSLGEKRLREHYYDKVD